VAGGVQVQAAVGVGVGAGAAPSALSGVWEAELAVKECLRCTFESRQAAYVDAVSAELVMHTIMASSLLRTPKQGYCHHHCRCRRRHYITFADVRTGSLYVKGNTFAADREGIKHLAL
jgi:hypothetical protein